MTRGKLIAIEGIDGSGKRTQLDLLARTFDQRAIPYVRVSFPNYASSFGKLVARFLNGEFGSLREVDAHFSALLYAGDRFESRPDLEAAISAGKTVLADRYVGSNLAHQTARVPEAGRAEFIAWLRQLEYEIYGLPAEDLVIYLRLPAQEAHRLIALKQQRDYTHLNRDIQEADVRHLEAAAGIYDRLASEPNWVRVDCWSAPAGDSAGMPGTLLSPPEIQAAILEAIDSRVPELQGALRRDA
jgi:dTMP kinase